MTMYCIELYDVACLGWQRSSWSAGRVRTCMGREGYRTQGIHTRFACTV